MKKNIKIGLFFNQQNNYLRINLLPRIEKEV